MEKVKIGWGEVSFVPENNKKVNLAGQFYERISSEVESDITATALAVECGGEIAIFCSCDLCGTSKFLLDKVREILSKNKNFPLNKVMLNAIHSHTSHKYMNASDTVKYGAGFQVINELMPDVKYEELVSYSGNDYLKPEEAFEFIAEKVAKAITIAYKNRKEGYYAQGFGRAPVGMCRRVVYNDGSAKMWGDVDTATFEELEGGNDSGIELLFTFDTNKKLTGVIANVACPAQVLEHRSFISSDYFGKVKEYVRKKYGKKVFVLGLVSPAGDQCPRDLVRWVEPESPINDPNIIRNNVKMRKQDPSMFDLNGCKLIGRRITNEIIYALEGLTNEDFVSNSVLKHEVLTIDMPLRRVTPKETEIAIKAIKDFYKENGDKPINYKDNARLHVYAGTIARSKIQEDINVIPIEVHVIRLGNVAFATNPYELFLNYANKIRARSKAEQTFLIQLSCGSFGYLPTKKAEEGSHYSAYVSSGTSGHEGGDLLVRKTLETINALMED
ncbi:MAG: hypothetical protein J6Q58_02475 [Clostridia bacterium]|nr:hypothetical protein [Clostridia bacterium]